MASTTTVFPLQIHVDEKKSPDDSEHKIPEPDIYYLEEFSNKEIEALQNRFNQPWYELEKTVASYKKTYRYERFMNWMTNGSNLPYAKFVIDTGKNGIRTLVQTVSPDTLVPDSVGTYVGAPAATLDTLFWMSQFSAQKKAVIATLEYAYSIPMKQRVEKYFSDLRNMPTNTIKISAKYVFNHSILWISNATGSMTIVLGLENLITPLPRGLFYTAVGISLIVGKRFFKHFTDDDYFDGQKFLFETKAPSLQTKFIEGEKTAVIQVGLQGLIGSVALRAYPLYYFLAISSEELLGWWFPAPLVAVAATIHGLFAFYPSIYNEHFGPSNKIDELLYERHGRSMELRVNQNRAELGLDPITDPLELTQETKILLKNMRHLVEQKILKELPAGFVIRKEPGNLIHMSLRTAIGGYFFGYKVVTPLLMMLAEIPVLMPMIGILAGSLFFNEFLRISARQRVLNQHVLKKIEAKEHKNASQSSAEPSQSKCSQIALSGSANLVNSAGALALGIAVIGSLNTTGKEISFLTVAVVSVALEKAIGSIIYSRDRVYDTVSNFFSCRKKMNSYGNNENNKKSSWCCYRRR